jgi:LacI family transcriptional regulator
LNVTIKDLARIARVSPSTVSRALADSPLVADGTRRQIQQLARNFQYSPNSLARGLVKRRSNLLGLLVPDITNPFFSEWAQAAENEAARQGYAVILCSTMRKSDQEDLKIRSLLELRVAGLFTCSLNVRNPNVVGLASVGIPTVFCDVELPGVDKGKAYLIHGKDVLGAEMATWHLIGLNRRNICHIAGTEETLATEYRLRGYRKALDAAGQSWEQRRVVYAEYSERGGYEAMLRLLEANPDVDAVYAANDLIAIGAMEAIGQSGHRVPQDISIVGYDDIRLASLVHPRLTTVRQSAFEMGRQGMRMLLEALEGGERPPRTIEIEPSLIIRESCGAKSREEV